MFINNNHGLYLSLSYSFSSLACTWRRLYIIRTNLSNLVTSTQHGSKIISEQERVQLNPRITISENSRTHFAVAVVPSIAMKNRLIILCITRLTKPAAVETRNKWTSWRAPSNSVARKTLARYLIRGEVMREKQIAARNISYSLSVWIGERI